MKIKLLAVGSVRSLQIEQLIQVYASRLKNFVSFTVEEAKEVPVKKGFPPPIAVDREGEILLEKLAESAYVVALDPLGKQKTTEQFATSIAQWEQQAKKEIVFVVGGPYGLAESIFRRANERLALSKMTLTHEMARLIWAEQLYRAYTILKNIPYHH